MKIIKCVIKGILWGCLFHAIFSIILSLRINTGEFYAVLPALIEEMCIRDRLRTGRTGRGWI